VYLVQCPASFAWGCNGHKTVGYIAFERLNPHAKTAAIELLGQLAPMPGLSHYCPGDVNHFVEVSTWADDIRSLRPETGPWHYVDIPRGVKKYDKKYCPLPRGCLITAIQQQLDVLRNKNAPLQDRSLALIFVIHFLGDLHQPLHDISNNDRGGNCVPVNFFGQQTQEFTNESFRPNLHGIWDTDLVEKVMQGRSVPEFAAYLDRRNSDSEKSWAGRGPDITKWALEGHQIAEAAVYGKLPVPVGVEAPVDVKLCSDDNHVSHRMADLHEVVDQGYLDATQEVLEVQLTRAGVRLAAILNRIWK
jgi:S1/P1 Nuclease